MCLCSFSLLRRVKLEKLGGPGEEILGTAGIHGLHFFKKKAEEIVFHRDPYDLILGGNTQPFGCLVDM